eukprot:1143275-Pleurochrysis_carterae.AAC.1
MADAFTPSDTDPDWLAPCKVIFEDLCRMMWDLNKAAGSEGCNGLSPGGLRQRLERCRRSGTPKATVPFGMEADDIPSPCHPRNLCLV